MTDANVPVEEPTTEATQVEAPAGGDSSGGDNPAWEPIRSSLDENTYSLIKPHLSKFDQEASRRIAATNEKYGWAGQLTESGQTPEKIQAAVRFAQQLEENPVEMLNRLRGFVEENYPDDYGKLDWIARQQQALADGQLEAPNLDEDEDPRFAEIRQQQEELAQQQEAQRDFLQQQEQTRVFNEMTNQIDRDVTRIREARPDIAREDWAEILNYCALQANQGQMVTVEQAVGWFDSIANRIRTTPRPGDSAPDLLPLGGGNAARPQTLDPSNMTDAQIQEFIASDLEAKKAQRRQ